MRHEAKIKDYLQHHLSTNSAWASRAVVKLFERQTATEQTTATTRVVNQIGFSGADAEFLTSIAQQLISGRTLTPKQLPFVFKKVSRYWKQVWSMIPERKQKQIVSKVTGECPDCSRPINTANGMTFCTGKCGWWVQS